MIKDYYERKIGRFFWSNKVILPWVVRICEAKRTCGEATFLIKYHTILKISRILEFFRCNFIKFVTFIIY